MGQAITVCPPVTENRCGRAARWVSPVADSVGTMRWLHTSDWHLGRGFHGDSLQSAQEEMLRTVCTTVEEHSVDVLLVSGDVYDRALPPEWAVRRLEECLLRLADGGTRVIVTSGNHDSAQRLGFGGRLMAASGVYLRTALEDSWDPVVLSEGGGATALVYGVPYLEPALVREPLELERADHTSVMRTVVSRIWEDVERRRDELAEGQELHVVLMAHLFAARGAGSDSERNLGVEAPAGEVLEHSEETAGGLAVVPLEVFDGFDYVALGHLHGRQRLSPTVRYSGSPLRYSFSETRQAKGAWFWDSTDWREVTPVDWSIGRPLAQLEATIDEVLSPQTVEAHRESYLQVRLIDPVRPARAFQRVQEAYPHLASFSHTGGERPGERSTYSSQVERARSDADVVEGFFDHVRGRGMDREEQELLEGALEAVRLDRAERDVG